MVEVIVALAVLAIVVTAVGVELGIQATSVSTSRNKLVAEGLITRAFSRVRALPYPTVVNGLRDGDATTTGTPHITKSGSTWTFVDTTEAGQGTGEHVLHSDSTTPTTPNPLDPHTATSTPVNHIDYTISVFPTEYQTPPAGSPASKVVTGVVRVTAIASWTTPHHSTPESITSQTLLYSFGTPCDPGHPQPFGAPCKPNFVASAAAGGGSIQVAPASSDVTPLQEGQFQSVDLDLPSVTTTNDLLQNTSVAGTAQATAALLTPGSSGSHIARVSTGATNDPSSTLHAINTPNGEYDHAALAQSPTPPTQVKVTSRAGDSIAATPSSGDSGASTSTITAKTTQDCEPTAGATATLTEPCGSSSALQGGPASITATLIAGTAHLGTATLASVDKAVNADDSYVAHFANNRPSCPTTRTYGCITAAAAMGLGTVTLAGLPSAFTAPPDWNRTKGLIELSGFSASISSSALSGTTSGHVATPTTSVPASGSGTPTPTLTYWNGSGYQSEPLGASGVSPTVPNVTQVDQVAPNVTVTASISASLAADVVARRATTSASCATACTATGSLEALTAQLTYKVTEKTVTASGTKTTVIADLAITVNLGSVSVHSSYQKAT